MPRAHFVTYQRVIQIHPDGSSTQTIFRDYASDPDTYISEVADSIRRFDKNIYFDRDTEYNSQSTVLYDKYCWIVPLRDPLVGTWSRVSGYCDVITEDKSTIRGQILSKTVFGADGILKVKTEYTYTDVSTLTSDWMWFNDFTEFFAIKRYYFSPLLTETKTTVYENGVGISTREISEYNTRGQLTTKKTISPEGRVDAMHFRYCHSSGINNPSGLENLISDAIKTTSEGNHIWITAAEHYTYGIAQPTTILEKVYDSPFEVSSLTESGFFSISPDKTIESTFSYNSKHRLIHASLPGGATIDYSWDSSGKNVLSKAVNGTLNRTQFEWKDLVGLTQMTDSSGQVERYEYDTHNRPWKTVDTDGRTISVFNYKIKND